MDNAVIQIRTNKKLKDEAMAVADELGLSLSSLIKAFLGNVTKTKSVTFSVREEPSPYLIETMKNAKTDIKKGYISPTFANPKDAINWLNDPNAKYKNGRSVSK